MNKKQLTQEERSFRLDDFTLNNQLSYWINKSKCFEWNLKKGNQEYDLLRVTNDHVSAMQILIKRMFELGKNN
jgi:hypothetical protein